MRRGMATAIVLCLSFWLSAGVVAADPPLQEQLYEITSPRANAEVRGSVEVVGSARLGPEFQFYKVEYASSATPEAWVVIGDVHRQEITNATLEVWHTTALPDGAYFLHLVVVKQDGNLVQTQPMRVQVANTQPAPTATPSESPTPTATLFVPTPTAATVEQPTVVRTTPTATPSTTGEEILPSPTPQSGDTIAIPSAGVFVKQCIFGAFVAVVLFIFAGVVLLLRRLI
jgi:hypothetical protein